MSANIFLFIANCQENKNCLLCIKKMDNGANHILFISTLIHTYSYTTVPVRTTAASIMATAYLSSSSDYSFAHKSSRSIIQYRYHILCIDDTSNIYRYSLNSRLIICKKIYSHV